MQIRRTIHSTEHDQYKKENTDKTQNVFYNFVGYMSNMDNDNIRDEVIGNVIVFT